MNIMFCWNCGEKLKDYYKVCPKCGKKVVKSGDDITEDDDEIEIIEKKELKTNKDSIISFAFTSVGFILCLLSHSVGLIMIIIGFVIAIYALKIAKIEGTSSFLAKLVIVIFAGIMCLVVIGIDYINYETNISEKCSKVTSCTDNGDGTALCKYEDEYITCSTD